MGITSSASLDRLTADYVRHGESHAEPKYWCGERDGEFYCTEMSGHVSHGYGHVWVQGNRPLILLAQMIEDDRLNLLDITTGEREQIFAMFTSAAELVRAATHTIGGVIGAFIHSLNDMVARQSPTPRALSFGNDTYDQRFELEKTETCWKEKGPLKLICGAPSDPESETGLCVGCKTALRDKLR